MSKSVFISRQIRRTNVEDEDAKKLPGVVARQGNCVEIYITGSTASSAVSRLWSLSGQWRLWRAI